MGGRLMASKARGDWWMMLLTLAVITIPAAFLVNRTVTDGYMDEEFHFRQVQHYCQGDFAYWDPKITTFPGLYISSLAYTGAMLPFGKVLGFQSSMSDLCQPVVLRSLNIFFSFICAILFREIALHLDPEKNARQATVKALVLSLYPLHWFFNFLFYTELGSASAVMAMYLASLKRAFWTSALFGVIAIMFRQTNAVWVVFVICVGVLNHLQNPSDLQSQVNLFPSEVHQETVLGYKKLSPEEIKSRSESLNDGDHRFIKDGVRKRQSGKIKRNAFKNAASSGDAPLNSIETQGIFAEILSLMRTAWARKADVLWNFGPLILEVLAFIGFVIHNGSIVVGDKQAHKVSPHFTQLLYCGVVSAAFQAAVHFSPQNVTSLFQGLRTSAQYKILFWCITTACAAFISVQFYSVAHPYLLADNRHYTFYIWKDILQRHWSVKYLAIPLYLYSWWSILFKLGEKQKALWIIAFVLALVGVLVPTPLIEFRYYNIPFYFIFLHSGLKALSLTSSIVLVAVEFMIINMVTLYIFLFWPFKWANQPENFQRFMW